jgi:hypothetical protein
MYATFKMTNFILQRLKLTSVHRDILRKISIDYRFKGELTLFEITHYKYTVKALKFDRFFTKNNFFSKFC